MKAVGERRRGYRMVARAEAKAATRERILDSTERLFFTCGSDQFSLDDVAHGAGTTVQTVLRHFGSKDFLLSASFERAMGRIRDQRMGTSVGDTRGAVENVVGHYEELGDVVIRWLASEESNPFVREVVDRGREFHREWVARTFAPQLERVTGVARRRRLAQLVALTDVYVWKLLRRDMTLDRKQTETAIVDLITALEEAP